MEYQVSSISEGERLLAAVMVSDAVGFSTHMSMDEKLTLQLIERDLILLAQICERFQGKVLKSTGDGLLMYFLGAVEAVSCGLEMQRQLIELAGGLPPEQYLEHRIGIHLGEIVRSEQDVMGNGVNITARLQTYAKPRGLCVSQTIYDVVKSRLNLHATFLGPLHLKNIREPVPAYQLALQAEPNSHLPTNDELTQAVMLSSDALLGEAVRVLTIHTQSLRIKKLIFAAYQQVWENDPAVIEPFSLQTLLVSLRERYPTLADLEQKLRQVVLGLNRQTVYQELVTLILTELQPWYRRSLCPTTGELDEEATVLTVRTLEERCSQVAQKLQQHPNSVRLRKLLYYLCHSTWENDGSVLNQVDTFHLVHQTLQLAPRSQDLRYHLSRIVKRVSRPQEYTRLANELMTHFQSLYLDQGDNHPLATPLDGASPATNSHHTAVPLTVPRPLRNLGDLTTLQPALGNPLPKSPAEALDRAPPRRRCRDRADLFDLRLEILQYTNPLQTKILLHSCLYGPFGYTDQDWNNLSRTTLEDLLRQLFEYCPTYADLDSKLTITAHCLWPGNERVAIAGTIVQALQAYY